MVHQLRRVSSPSILMDALYVAAIARLKSPVKHFCILCNVHCAATTKNTSSSLDRIESVSTFGSKRGDRFRSRAGRRGSRTRALHDQNFTFIQSTKQSSSIRDWPVRKRVYDSFSKFPTVSSGLKVNTIDIYSLPLAVEMKSGRATFQGTLRERRGEATTSVVHDSGVFSSYMHACVEPHARVYADEPEVILAGEH